MACRCPIPSTVRRRVRHDATLEFARLRARAVRAVGESLPHNRLCLLWAIAAMHAARRSGLEVMLQAGSAGWRCVNGMTDDGVSAVNYCYQYEDDLMMEQVHRLLGLAPMPEMHAWAAVRQDDWDGGGHEWHVVDLTTRFVPGLFRQMPGSQPVSKAPPSAVFLPASEIRGMWYRPAAGAMRHVAFVLRDMAGRGVFDRDYLVTAGVLK